MPADPSWKARLLREKVKPFLETVRVGIDFGEYAGGIAILKGNEIRHAEVFLDFHETTLEQRRDFRRNRRTRHAKKMRLARLRSWVLRQKRSDGSRWFSDPYELMRRKEFQCQPGEYAVGKGNLAAVKGNLPTWSEAVRRGERTDPDSFIIALTHLFQKRGFGYSDADLEAMNDAQLRDFLASACLKNSPLMFLQKLDVQVKRRELVEEDTDQTWRGKTKVQSTELRELFDQAKKEPPKRRKAVHRREKVAILRDMIRKFGEANGLSDDNIKQWQNELAGPDIQEDFDPRKKPKGLLNKVLRAPRFENRVRGGCAWCGKTCARKSKFRKQAYLAAINNLRVWEIPPSSRLLAGWQKERLRSIWHEGSSNPKEAKQKFLGLCRLFGIRKDKQQEFASLFDAWAANGGEFEKQLKTLRSQVSGQKARPLTADERKKFEELWTGELKEDVSQDGVFWKNFNHKISEIFAELRQSDHPIANDALKKQLTDLLTVQPKGRHRLCPTCLGKAARGETMFDQGIDPWTIKLRSAPNPCRTQHQQRILRRLEHLLFQQRLVDPQEVKYITLEIPKPQSNTAPKKGEQTKTERRSPKALLHEEAFGKCMYCDKELDVTQVTEDHVFPQSWGGPDLRMTNLICACQDCNNSKTDAIPFLAQHIVKLSWDAFVGRVRGNPRLSPRKKDMLLLGSHGGDVEGLESFKALGIPLDELTDEQREEFVRLARWQQGDPFPSDPTALARAGAMPRPFLQGIRKMFEKHDLASPEITPIGDASVIQRAEGWMTARLRNSWRYDLQRKANFPVKATDGSLDHHAQDAALLAALPPHQWREQIFIEEEQSIDGRPLSGLALKKLAPNWDEFNRSRKVPLVHIFGASKITWRRAWRKNFLKETFWKVRKEEAGAKKKRKKGEASEGFSSKPSPKKEWLSTKELSERKGEFLKGETWQHKPQWENLQNCPRCGKPLSDDRRNNQVIGKRCQNCKGRFFQSDIAGRHRYLKKSQPQGQVLVIYPKDGPPRVVNAEGVAEAVCLVKNGENYSVKVKLQPAVAGLLNRQYDPPLAPGEEVLSQCELRRDALIKLPEKRVDLALSFKKDGSEKLLCYPAAVWRFVHRGGDGKIALRREGEEIVATFIFPEGYYRVKELSLKQRNVEVWYESVAKGVSNESWCCPQLNIGHLKIKPLAKEERVQFGENAKNILRFCVDDLGRFDYGVKGQFPERKLSKGELVEYFQSLNGEKHHDPGAAS